MYISMVLKQGYLRDTTLVSLGNPKVHIFEQSSDFHEHS